MSMNILLAFIIMVTLGCISNQPSENDAFSRADSASHTIDSFTYKDSILTNYPSEITSIGAERFFDETKWRLYCIHCDERVVFLKSELNNWGPTYGECNLTFDNVEIRGSDIEINFTFEYDTIPLIAGTIIHYPTRGAVFDIDNGLIKFYTSVTTARYFKSECIDISKCKDRFVKPLQPEVIKYIQKNENKINPWFRREAVKRGVLKD